jgi:hypothetical protein
MCEKRSGETFNQNTVSSQKSMKNLKLVKDYFNTLTSKGKAFFVLAVIVAAYLILDQLG